MPDRLLFSLSKIHYRLTSHFKRELKRIGIDLSPGQIGILLVLEGLGETTMGDLSRTLEIDNAAITRLVDKLEKSQLVGRRINPHDRRQMLIEITDEGLQKATAVKKVAHAANKKIGEGFSNEEMAIYKRVNQAILQKFSWSPLR